MIIATGENVNVNVMEKNMIHEALAEYGALGLFVVYLIYDRQIVLKKILKALEGIERKLNGK